jgi:GTP-binding protein HflX
MHEVTGNRAGLKPSELSALERVYRRRVASDEVVSAELGAYLCEVSRAIGRQVGVLISRRGDIEHVFVGDASRIVLPEVGRLRAGHGRFRGLRLVHTHLRNETLSRDDLVDLALLRLDLVAAVGVNHEGRPADLHLAHLLPPREGKSPWVSLPPTPFHRASVDPAEIVAALEEEFERVLPSTRATRSAERALLVVAEIGKSRGGSESLVRSLPALPAAEHRGRVWEPSQGFQDNNSRVRSLPALPAAEHRGRVWEPSQGFQDNNSRVRSLPALGTCQPAHSPPRASPSPSPVAEHRRRVSEAERSEGEAGWVGGCRGQSEPAQGSQDNNSHVHELRELCRTAGILVVDVAVQRRPEPDPRYLIGRGKLEDVLVRAMQYDASVLIFDPDLSPGQAHAIASFTDLKVIDRTILILDIFAQRARSRDAKLQVELAQLRYRLPRLHEENTMMSRLVGGIGGRGPGETKLEIGRRRARERLHRLEKDIEQTRRQRAGRRSAREDRGLPVVAIVGYTNAGKSTLLNGLTDSDVLVEDKLFATLDPTTRRLRFPRERELILADTVGFIRDLPKDLAQAFHATLEELDNADLLLHVVDASDPDRDAHITAVERILGDLNLAETPRLLVYNKADRLLPEEKAILEDNGRTIAISALDRQTIGPLLTAMEEALWREGHSVGGYAGSP